MIREMFRYPFALSYSYDLLDQASSQSRSKSKMDNDDEYPKCCCFRARSVLICSLLTWIVYIGFLAASILGFELFKDHWKDLIGNDTIMEIWEECYFPALWVCGLLAIGIFITLIAASCNCVTLLVGIWGISFIPLIILAAIEGYLGFNFIMKLMDSERMGYPGYLRGQIKTFSILSFLLILTGLLYFPFVILLQKTLEHSIQISREKRKKAVDDLMI
ncbi:hypothetical protein WR25_26907 [Diploscapter pachys]|uniref:Uncharacterized protein n=1 Tax=Diploscapter pachys TaxID=2018661 RepID=A0A2A2JIU3_9BILA|nr:hypothetical protein WR25_26907 [Diploscapter pachys]